MEQRSFMLTNSERTLHAVGNQASWPTTKQAAEALAEGDTPMIVGALPFHRDDAPVLFAPRQAWFEYGAPHDEDAAIPATLNITERPSAEEHRRRVAEAVETIKHTELQKVVLARRVEFSLDATPHPRHLFQRFIHAGGTGNAHLCDLTPAGPKWQGQWLIGSSPELLIAKRGAYIESHPLAGTAPRALDPVHDQAQATQLACSTKDLAEHAYVTEQIRQVLAPLCTHLNIPQRPSITRTAHTWHLGTPIVGQLKDPSISALDLALLLHPTPAVAGYPTDLACEFLAEHEPDRGFYAGAVGWADSEGNGEWRVTIRSSRLAGSTLYAHAGGGIVETSDPATEVTETTTKLGPVRTVLGLDQSGSAAARQ